MVLRGAVKAKGERTPENFKASQTALKRIFIAFIFNAIESVFYGSLSYCLSLMHSVCENSH